MYDLVELSSHHTCMHMHKNLLVRYSNTSRESSVLSGDIICCCFELGRHYRDKIYAEIIHICNKAVFFQLV